MLLLEQLLHSSNMPPLCTQGVLDPVPARAALLMIKMSNNNTYTNTKNTDTNNTMTLILIIRILKALILHDLSDPAAPTQAELDEKLEQVRARFTPHLALRAAQVGAYGREGIGSFGRNSYVSTLTRPVVVCPYLCTSEALVLRLGRGGPEVSPEVLRGSLLSNTTYLSNAGVLQKCRRM